MLFDITHVYKAFRKKISRPPFIHVLRQANVTPYLTHVTISGRRQIFIYGLQRYMGI